MGEPTRDDLVQIAKLIRKFMREHGGASNGYETMVDGDVRVDTYSRLRILIPNAGDKTIQQMRDLGREVYDLARNYMVSRELRGTIRVRSVHVEYGCHKLSVSYKMDEESFFSEV